MFKLILNFLRKRSLKNFGQKEPSSMIPLSKINRVISFIDLSDPQWKKIEENLQVLYKKYHFEGEIYRVDLRGKDTAQVLENKELSLWRGDLTFWGRPSKSKIRTMMSKEYDLLLYLVNDQSFTSEFIALACKSQFKIGLKTIGNIFDIVFNINKVTVMEEVAKEGTPKAITEPKSGLAVVGKIDDLLSKIK